MLTATFEIVITISIIFSLETFPIFYPSKDALKMASKEVWKNCFDFEPISPQTCVAGYKSYFSF